MREPGDADQPVDLPTRRRHPFDPPPELAELRQQCPVAPLALPDGTAGWIVSGHTETREVLTDPRFSARHELRTLPPGEPTPPTATPGFFVRMDAPDHTRYRKLVASHFTRRRLRDLAPRIVRITDAHLDAIEAGGAPFDLVTAYGMPIPSLVIGELLGVEAADRDEFQAASRTAVDLTASPAEVAAALSAITALLRDLVVRKQRNPGDDVISALLSAAPPGSGGLEVDEVAAMAFLLLVAGHETTANMISLGVFALLCFPRRLQDFRAALDADPDDEAEDGPAARAVEELLRYLTINQFGAMRVVHEDLQFHGRAMRRGDAVILSLPAANRDPGAFAEPDVLQLDRSEAGHLAFGHGAHLCTGASLARLELRIVYARLLRRFPTLRLAVAPQQVPLRQEMSIYGVHSLPLTW